MDNWFDLIAAKRVLSSAEVEDLHDVGFVVVPGPVEPTGLRALAESYDSAVAAALASEDSEVAKTSKQTTRVHDFVNRGPAFDGLYVFQPVLEACCHVIRQPFKLSSMLARTLRAHVGAQELHADFRRDDTGWPMVGFIFMIDEFRPDNGATRFVPGSHKLFTLPDESMQDTTAPYEGEMLGCGPAGSMVIYNGSIWHGHTANQSDRPRRSIQGAFIRRDAQAYFDRTHHRAETLDRIGVLAKYLLDLEPGAGE